MARALPRYCPRCGAPVVTNAGSCSTCGLPVEAMLSRSAGMQTARSQQYSQDQPDQQPTQSYPQVQQGNPQHASFQTPIEPVYAPAPKKRGMGRKALIPLVVALLVLLAAAGYVIAGLQGVHLPGFGNYQSPVTTKTIDATVPYAGVDITIVNVQQSQNFINDPNSSDNGMVRLNLREQNSTGIKVSWNYNTIARLILPDKSIADPVYVKAEAGIAPGTSQTSVLDFAVPTSDTISQLTLRLGAPDEAQMLIPLTGKADLSKYQPRSINLNRQMLYFGLNWTLTNATSSLSIDGQQAAKDMRYITVTLKVDNTLSQIAVTGSSHDYVRLKFGSTTASPKNTTLPVSFNAGAMGQTGTVSFLVPQHTQSFTLLLVPQSRDASSDQDSTDFQLA